MAYLTKHNSLRIIASTEVKGNRPIEGEIYKKPIFFFNNLEKTKLLYLELLFRDPKEFLQYYYKKVRSADHFKYVYEGNQPAYHLITSCNRLNSDFINFPIPEKIKNSGEEEIWRFRDTFKKYRYLLDRGEKLDIEKFCMHIKASFDIIIDPNSIIRSNSGITELENLNLVEIETRIDKIISAAGKFFRECDDESKKALRRFQKHTYLANPKNVIPDNDINMLEDELRTFLGKYDADYKIPLKNALMDYYRVKYNPDLHFESSLLDQLGFKPCNNCHNPNIDIDDL